MIPLRYLDIVILILALPVFLAGGPADARLRGGGARRGSCSARSRSCSTARRPPRTTRASVAGIAVGSMIGRAWLVALTIFAAGLAEGDDAGLAAAVLILVLFTAYFTVSMIMRPFDKPQQTA